MLSSALFIGGCDRSGTTLLGSLIGRSPAAHVTPESQFKVQVVLQAGGVPRDFKPSVLFRESVVKTPRWGLWQGASDDLALEATDYGEFLLALASSHGRASGADDGAHLWVDHTPQNLHYAHILGAVIPSARFVHIVRDGRAVCASQLALPWGPRSPLQAAEYWKGRISEGLALESSEAFSGRVHRVTYEDLVLAPEATLRGVCEFAGIPFDPAMLEGGGFDVPGFTSSQHELVGSAPDAARIQAWRAKLMEADQRAYEWSAGSLLQSLGYACDFWPHLKGVPRRVRARYAVQEYGPGAWAARRTQVRRNRELQSGAAGEQ